MKNFYPVELLIAQEEHRLISERTKAALAAAKARGVKIGNPLGAKAFGDRSGAGAAEAKTRKANAFAIRLVDRVLPLRAKGMTLRAIAAELNAAGIRTARGETWYANSVKRLIDRLEGMASQ